MEKTKPSTTKARIHQSKDMYGTGTRTQNKHKNPKPGFIAFYDIPPGNAAYDTIRYEMLF